MLDRNLNQRRKQEMMRQLQEQQRLEQLRQDQEKYGFGDKVKQFNTLRSNAGQAGKTLSNSSNKTLANIGNRLYSGTGERAVDTLKGQVTNAVKNQASNIAQKVGTKMATEAATNAGVNAATTAGTNALATGATTAGTTAATGAATGATTGAALGAGTAAGTAAGTGAALGAGTGAAAAGTGAATAGAAGAGAAGGAAAGGMAAAGPIGWAALAAYMIYNMVNTAKQKKNAEAMKMAEQEGQKSQQAMAENKQEAMQNFQESKQEHLNNMNEVLQQPSGYEGQLPQLDNEALKQELTAQVQQAQQPMPEIPEVQEGMTGAAAPIAQPLPYDGSATQELDRIASEEAARQAQKNSILDMFKGSGEALNVPNGLKDFYAGYQDNSKHGFTEGDLFKQIAGVQPSKTEEGVMTGGAEDIKKSMMTRLGELAGTGQRVMANPLTQGVLAGTAYAIDEGDALYGLGKGVEWAKNKARSNYYGKKLDPNYTPKVFDNYDADDYKAQTLADYRQVSANKNNMSMDDYYRLRRDMGDLSEEQYQEIISSPEYDGNAVVNINGYKAVADAKKKTGDLENNTKKTDAQIKHWERSDNNASNRNRTYQQSVDQQGKNITSQIENRDKKTTQEKQDALDSGAMVRMKAPDGSVRYIPAEYVEDAKRNGGVVL